MKVLLTADAEKQFRKLPKPEQRKIEKKLKLLSVNPHTDKKLTGEYAQERSIRAWPYRIIYGLSTHSNQEIVIVFAILHRQGAYVRR
jgi:mRNA-degrading endonuclease RelE of RelBE toxin-antitoxin system